MPDHTPQQILELLLEGNRRFREGRPEYPQQDLAHRSNLTEGQNPKAGILGCADSRVPSELIFDRGFGDLFVVRGAGQIADETNLASLEYAVAILGLRLIMVMGHASCGAVQATLDSESSGETLPGHLPHLVEGIRASIDPSDEGDVLYATTCRHVEATCELIRHAEPILAEKAKGGELLVVPAFYHLEDGRVEILGA